MDLKQDLQMKMIKLLNTWERKLLRKCPQTSNLENWRIRTKQEPQELCKTRDLVVVEIKPEHRRKIKRVQIEMVGRRRE
jgi:hypothetical protein